MTLFSLTVGKNEEHRYLAKMLRNTSEYVDGMFFFDDRSDDRTAEIALNAGCVVAERSEAVPSFMEHEGWFRQGAWRAFEDCMEPKEGDWVFVIDCDEFLVPSLPGSKFEYVNQAHVDSVMVTIPEVFGFDNDGWPLVRVDRLWGTIHAPRLFPYRRDAVYSTHQSMGVPAVPTYAMSGAWGALETFVLLHMGYARVEDQRRKYERYTMTPVGHSSAHVQSILATDKELIRWNGGFVD